MNDARPPDRVVRRDADGEPRVAPSWESLTERLIREAQEDGRFDDLPSRGRPLQVDDDPHAGDMALAYHVLRNARIAPPWIELDKEARRLADAVDALVRAGARSTPVVRRRQRERLARLIDEHTSVVRRLELLAPTPGQQRRALDRDALLATFDAARGDERTSRR